MRPPFFSRWITSWQRGEERRRQPAKHVVSAGQGNRTILLDSRTGHYFGLDEVGSQVWQLMGEGQTAEEVTRKLVQEYDVPFDVLQADVEVFVRQLKQQRLLEDA